MLRYLTLAEVAFQTVFWAIFCAFQVFSLAGQGIIEFEVSKSVAKKAIIFLGVSYVANSAYMVTVEHSSLSRVLKYVLVVFLIYFVVSSSVDFVRTRKVITTNIEFVQE